ncbi:MAG TPA: hypothetical protein VN647_10465 [Nitrospira sp.]|nr:hypothetical protein [Nitrospira sp.]
MLQPTKAQVRATCAVMQTAHPSVGLNGDERQRDFAAGFGQGQQDEEEGE